MGDKGKTKAQFCEFIKENPLIRLPSTYSQVTILIEIGKEIIEKLDSGIEGNTLEAGAFDRVYGLFWLWVLGAYEVFRVMDKDIGSEHFSESFKKEIERFHGFIKEVRVPFAKQQLAGGKRGKETPAKMELSVTSIDTDLKDFAFEIKGDRISIRETITDFIKIISEIKPEDLIGLPIRFRTGDQEFFL